MKKPFGLIFFCTLLLLGSACGQAQEENHGPPSVADLLSAPAYDSEVNVFGLVSDLGALFCPCFTLSSGGESLTVWYDLMIQVDGSQLPAVSVEEIHNGEVITVTGLLQESDGTEPTPNLYATHIVKGTDPEACDTTAEAEATPCPEE